jgi:hypothetical protein
MLRWVRRAAIASSFLRVNFAPGPAIRYQPIPLSGARPIFLADSCIIRLLVFPNRAMDVMTGT